MGRGTKTIGGSRDRDQCNFALEPTDCDTTPCCSTMPCSLCLKYTDENGNKYTSEAALVGQQYNAKIRSYLVNLIWEQDAEGECAFVVKVDNYEIARYEKCTEASCRSPMGSVAYLNGLLEWDTYIKPRRQATTGIDKCLEVPCVDCRCLCENICVIWRKDTGTGTDLKCQEYCEGTCAPELVELGLDEDCTEGGIMWGPVVFEPDCQPADGTRSISIELVEGTSGACSLQLRADGEIRQELPIAANGAECEQVEFDVSYVDDDSCVITITTECKSCGDPCFSADGNCKKGCCFTDIECLGGHIDSIPFRFVVPAGAAAFWTHVGALGSTNPEAYHFDFLGDADVGGACGACDCGFADASLTVLGQECVTSIPQVTPCARTFFFALTCESDFQGDTADDPDYEGNETVNACCSRMRLLVSAGGERRVSPPLHDLTNPEVLDVDVNCPTSAAWVEPYAELPVSCSCGSGGITGVIDLSSLGMRACNGEYPPACPDDDPSLQVDSADCCEPFADFSGIQIVLEPFCYPFC